MTNGELSHGVIIILVLLGATAVVIAGYGIHRVIGTRLSKNEFDRSFNERNAEQDQYMVDLRMAYRNGVMAETRPYRSDLPPGPGPRYSQGSSTYEKGSVMESRPEHNVY